MKKIFIMCSLLVCFTNYASTLVIENMCQGAVKIQNINIVLGNQSYNYSSPSNNPNYFQIGSMVVFEITDNLPVNRQFPFLNMYPFSGGFVTDTNGNIATLPLPTTTNNTIPTTSRFQFAKMRFQVDGDYETGFSMAYDYLNNCPTENYGETFVYDNIAGNPTYNVSYMRLLSFHHILFED